MGILSFLFKSPQKLEEKGDTYFAAEDFGSAKLEYEAALALIEKKHPDETTARDAILVKLKNSREFLARQHLKTGDNLVEANVADEAANLFSIALSLTEDTELRQKLQSRLTSTGMETPTDDITGFSTPGETQASYEPENENSDHTFEILCATLPEKTAEAYASYGDSFKEGYIALSNGEFETAAENLAKALDENPSMDSLIPVELATALIHLDQIDQAIDLLTRYTEDNPSSIQGVSLLCDTFCDLQRFDQAHEVIDRSPAGIRKSIGGQLHKGKIFFLEGNYKKAEENYRSAMESTGWHDDIARELAVTLDAAGKKEEALSIYADILNKCTGCGQRPNPLDQKSFADLSFEMNDFSDKTLKLYLDLANDYQEIRSDCFYKAGMIYRHNGNDEESERFLQLSEATG